MSIWWKLFATVAVALGVMAWPVGFMYSPNLCLVMLMTAILMVGIGVIWA